MPPRPPRSLATMLVAFLIGPVALAARTARWSGMPATSFPDRFREVWKIAPADDQSAEVNHLMLRRDVGEIILEEGRLYLLEPPSS